VFLWTPPHFWALSLNRADEYARAGVPMLPVVSGRAETARQILIYTILLFPISLLPWAFGFAGAIYGAIAAICGATFIALALRLTRSGAAIGAFGAFLTFLVFAFREKEEVEIPAEAIARFDRAHLAEAAL
jgi:heme o synthase